MIFPKWLFVNPDFFFPLCVDKFFILVTDILLCICWVCIMFFRSTQGRAARAIPLLSHGSTQAVLSPSRALYFLWVCLMGLSFEVPFTEVFKSAMLVS